MSIKLLVKLSLLFTIISGYQTFLQDDNTPIAQAVVASIPPTIGSYSNPQILSATSQVITLNYQLLTSAYQQAQAVLNGIQQIAQAYSSGSMSDEDFANLLLSVVPEPFASVIGPANIAQIYGMFADLYAGFVSYISNLILKVDALNLQFTSGAITDDQYVAGLNQIYQSNGGILDLSSLYSSQKQLVTVFLTTGADFVNQAASLLSALIPKFN